MSSNSLIRDPVPSSNASHDEVIEYLVSFFVRTKGFSRDAALTQARKLRTDGSGLYMATYKDLVELFGVNGRVLYYEIQSSEEGRVCLSNSYIVSVD